MSDALDRLCVHRLHVTNGVTDSVSNCRAKCSSKKCYYSASRGEDGSFPWTLPPDVTKGSVGSVTPRQRIRVQMND